MSNKNPIRASEHDFMASRGSHGCHVDGHGKRKPCKIWFVVPTHFSLHKSSD